MQEIYDIQVCKKLFLVLDYYGSETQIHSHYEAFDAGFNTISKFCFLLITNPKAKNLVRVHLQEKYEIST